MITLAVKIANYSENCDFSSHFEEKSQKFQKTNGTNIFERFL